MIVILKGGGKIHTFNWSTLLRNRRRNQQLSLVRRQILTVNWVKFDLIWSLETKSHLCGKITLRHSLNNRGLFGLPLLRRRPIAKELRSKEHVVGYWGTLLTTKFTEKMATVPESRKRLNYCLDWYRWLKDLSDFLRYFFWWDQTKKVSNKGQEHGTHGMVDVADIGQEKKNAKSHTSTAQHPAKLLHYCLSFV